MNNRKIILDIDSVGDDILALFFAALHPDFDLLAVSTVSGASGSIEQATRVALHTVEVTGKQIPVFRGAEGPLVKEQKNLLGDPVNFFASLEEKFGDRLVEMNKSEETKLVEEKEAAVDFIIRMAHQYKENLSLVCTGPTTNLAMAIQKDPSIVPLLGEIYVLGGAFHIPGNITPVSEYNIFADPEAAQLVLTSGASVTLVPLDICENNLFADSMLTRDSLFDITSNGKSPVSEYILKKFPIYIDVWRSYFQLVGFPMDDVITAAVAVEEKLCTYSERCHVEVALEGRLTRGQTIAFSGVQIYDYPNRKMKNVRIAKTVDGKRFMDLFISTIINGE